MSTIPTFHIPTPSSHLPIEEQMKRITSDLNRQLQDLTRYLKDREGESGKSPTFRADVDLQGHRTVNHADPVNLTDGANRRYVDEQNEEQNDQIREILDTLHDLPGGNNQSIILTRDVPTTVADIVEIGAFKLSQSAHTFDIAITVAASTFSMAKAYTIVSNYNINTDWEMVLPLFDTGPYSSQDYALDVKQDNTDHTLFLRLRRTLGTTAGVATIQIRPRGIISDLFLESNATASVTPPTAILESARLMVKDGDLLFNTETTQEVLATDTTFTIGGVEGEDERPAIAFTNRDPGTDSFTGEVRFYSEDTLVATASSRTDGATDAGLFSVFTKKTGAAITLTLRLTSLKNMILGGGSAAGSSAEKVFVVGTGVAPGSSPADSFQMYSADQTAGNATPHFRTENGTIILLFEGAALTAEDAAAVDATYGADEAGVINNVRTRLGEVITHLQALGLFP